MPQGDKSSYTDKQKRKAQHIEQSYKDRGVDHGAAQARAWATVNKDSGGGNQSGSGRGKPDSLHHARVAWHRPGVRRRIDRRRRRRAGKRGESALPINPYACFMWRKCDCIAK